MVEHLARYWSHEGRTRGAGRHHTCFLTELMVTSIDACLGRGGSPPSRLRFAPPLATLQRKQSTWRLPLRWGDLNAERGQMVETADAGAGSKSRRVREPTGGPPSARPVFGEGFPILGGRGPSG